MKKSLVALAVLGSFAGVAAAQSSVTLFGVVDAAARYTSANGQDLYSLASGGNTTSRLGVRGVEDLGGGLKASFWLETQVNVDAGTAAGSDGKFWGRRATVSLSGDFGTVNLGRNKNSTKLAYEDFDPTSATGLGSVENVINNLGTSAGLGRYDNQVTYVLPANLGGFYGSVDVAAGEGVDIGKSYSGRVGYKAAGINVSAAYMESGVNTKFKLATLGASYDFGIAKPSLAYTTTESTGLNNPKQEIWTAAVSAPLGAGSVWGSYTNVTFKGKASVAGAAYAGDAYQVAAGYTYNLSKRTALYTVVALIDNGAGARFSLANSPAVVADGRSGGFDLGVRHSF